MKKEVLEFLGCCNCKTELELEKANIWKGDVRSGVLICRKCGLRFPVAAGRPVIMTSESVSEWKSPVTEALGLKEYAALDESFENLSRMGLEEALKLLKKRKEINSTETESFMAVSDSVIAKMKYRESGRWFESGNRKDRLLQFPWRGGDPSDSFNIFMNRILSKEGENILDIASGGGFAVSNQAYLNKGAKQILAVERDLKCLGNIQYRFKYAGGNTNSEAVGGNVRELPVKTGSIDTAMMLNALPEICGLSDLLSEVYRVLKPLGCYIVLIPELPHSIPAISPEFAVQFAEAADLYSGYEKFESDAEKAGFQIESSEAYRKKSGKFSRLIEFRK